VGCATGRSGWLLKASFLLEVMVLRFGFERRASSGVLAFVCNTGGTVAHKHRRAKAAAQCKTPKLLTKIGVVDTAVKPQVHLEERTEETSIPKQDWVCWCPGPFA